MSKRSDKKSQKESAHSPFAGLQGLRDKLAAEEKAAAEGAKDKKKPVLSAPYAARNPLPTKAARGGGSSTSAGDDLEFHRLMNGVTPLEDRDRRHTKADAPRIDRSARVREPDTTMEHLRVLVDEGSKFEVVDDGRRVEGYRVDVPPDFVRRLRRGGFPVDAALDLHGRTTSESREVLQMFLREKRERGERCVLVIHGKGAHSPGGVGILRGEISAWLSQGPPSTHVAAFTTALESDGGEGALYVLLRR